MNISQITAHGFVSGGIALVLAMLVGCCCCTSAMTSSDTGQPGEPMTSDSPVPDNSPSPAPPTPPTPPLPPSPPSAPPTAIKVSVTQNVAVVSVQYSPDGLTLASAGNVFDDVVRLWDPRTGQALGVIGDFQIGDVTIDFAEDGTLVSAASSGPLTLWNAARTEPVWKNGPVGDVSFLDVAISPDGRRIVTAGSAVYGLKEVEELRIWDADTGEHEVLAADFPQYLRCVDISPDGRMLVCGTDVRTDVLRMYDMKTKQILWRKENIHSIFGVTRVTFSPDSKWIATASANEDLMLLDAATGDGLATLEGHGDFVEGVAFSPSGKLLASAGEDKTVRLWSVPQGRPLKTITGHTGPVKCVAFSPDGQRLVSGGRDATLRFWDIDEQQLLKGTGEEKADSGAPEVND